MMLLNWLRPAQIPTEERIRRTVEDCWLAMGDHELDPAAQMTAACALVAYLIRVNVDQDQRSAAVDQARLTIKRILGER